MQIMNLDKFVKNLWWTLTAFRTIDELPDSVIYVDLVGNIKKFNKKAQETFGLEESDDPTVIVNINDIIKDGSERINESLDLTRPILATATIPDREFYVELNASQKGKGYCLSIRDLTKLTTEIFNDDKTLRFNGEKNAMLAKLEGDIKSPITSISGFSRGLLDGLGGELTEKQAKYVKIINNNAEELYQFMDKFLEFSKAESSIYEPNYQNFDIIEMFKAVMKDYETVLADRRISFDIDYESSEKRTVYTDLDAIKNAFKNIIEVAISMTESGIISIKLTHPNEETCVKYNLSITANKKTSYLQITIRDTGSGIPEEEMRYLCEPYAQLEKGKKNFLRALKLGSASILVKRANGLFDICSEVRTGTKYEIVLPIEKE
ncbi:hypothetical protein IJ472_03490 [bacterium]|nr:hypothetical protein [bacterium]